MSMDDRPYGRRAFLGLFAGGVSSLWWGQAAWPSVSGALRPATAALPSQRRHWRPT